jgi:hypothetical protein
LFAWSLKIVLATTVDMPYIYPITNRSSTMSIKAGTPILVRFTRQDGSTGQERAKIARVMPYMLPIPQGYVPVRFEDGRLMVPVEDIEVAP